MKNFFLIIFLLFSSYVFSEDTSPKNYEILRKKYSIFPEDDGRAFQYLNSYIKNAKAEKRDLELFQGYRDAVYYSKSLDKKLKYADSCLDAAYKSSNDNRIATAYVLKGSVYYANYRKYKPALDEYLMAYKYSKDTRDLYLKNKVSYHLGVVKNYLGYHEEALELFKNCVSYFEAESNDKTSHESQRFNNKKGYINSLHQMVICYMNLKDTKKTDSLIDIGLLKTFNDKDFLLERSYFLKSKGLSEYNNNKYTSAIDYLNESLGLIKDDFAWISLDYFYIGKSYLALKDEEKAISYFKKTDSIFTKHDFILPELRENYELLINHYKINKDHEKQLFYTTQLLKADSIISRDFAYLSLKIHREYDTNTLIEEKGRLETANTWGGFLIAALFISGGIIVFILNKKYKKEKDTLSKYLLLEDKMKNNSYVSSENTTTRTSPVAILASDSLDEKKTQIAAAIKRDLLRKLQSFEEKKQFTQKGLTIQKLAIQMDTNTNYLSNVINEQKGMNFNKYLGDLRIRYITRLMFEKSIYLNYTIDTLAKECGIASRQNFSDLFYEINGIRPTDFIRKRKKELENNNGGNFSPLERLHGLL
ncbi:helix-turn-helix domain-containing protein [Epilithonimonas hungarica]|uniref:Helix-turn-helix domain-containing protein n=1 Tax=Epilithonimonas hungarica TaxID=454006 RepID=A0A1G7U2J1_9FLAO|nr:helix-turn-helix domain-containing protein [Epilithonimonas hungarica]MDP9955287.1 AraC-like DNA-binding protein/cbb3-type cytochrome oxidase subunit 3 [Epilithonimonas hungarica]SDG41766.1 Helix-turn-helix domain-containing protein [Epilithonimonas hungarica]